MRVRISRELCSGQGRCWKYAANVHELDDAGFNIYRGQEIEVPLGEEKAGIMAMKACPERAITLVEA